MYRYALTLLFLTTCAAIALFPKNAFGLDELRSNKVDAREIGRPSILEDLRSDGLNLNRDFTRIIVLRKWNGNLVNLRRLSDFSPSGDFRAFSGSQFIDQAVKALFPKAQFRDVSIRDCSLTDQGLKVIAASKTIENLRIEKCDITDEGLKTLQQTQQLKSLRVWNTKVTADGLKALQMALPDCQVEADVIPTQSRQLSNELRVTALRVLLQSARGTEEKENLWRGLYDPHSDVGTLHKQEVQRMRTLHPQFIKVLAERESLLKNGQTPADIANRITRGLKKIDRSENRLTPIATWLIGEHERGRLKKHPKRLALLAHYMDSLTQ